MNLSKIPTCDLVNELAKREGVREHSVYPYANYRIHIEERECVECETGPAHILVVID